MPSITQAAFEALLDDIQEQKQTSPEGQKFSLASYLTAKGYSTDIENINFAIDKKTVTHTYLARADGSIATATSVPRRTDLLTNLDFSGCQLKNCSFDFCDLSGGNFENVTIGGCSFNHALLNRTHLLKLQFTNLPSPCSFKNASFDYSNITHCNFIGAELTHCTFNYLQRFEYATFENCIIDNVSILGGVEPWEVSLCATDKSTINTHVAKSFVTDQPIFYENVMTENEQPTVLLCWNNTTPGMAATLAEQMLLDRHLIPVRMDYRPAVNEEILNNEINELNLLTAKIMLQLRAEVLNTANEMVAHAVHDKDLLSELDDIYNNYPLAVRAALIAVTSQLAQSKGNPNELIDALWKELGISFPMLMIQIMREVHTNDPNKFPQMAALYVHAKAVYDKVDGVLIPGGEDIDPRFYGAQLHPKTRLTRYSDYPEIADVRRDVLEFSLVYIQQRASAPKPLCGICRGSQVIAAAYGSTMYQDIADEQRKAFFIESIIPKSTDTGFSKPGETPLLSTNTRLASKGPLENLTAVYFHHQGYNLKAAHGIAPTASIHTASGIPIDVVGEHLQQNITITQAHPEFAYDRHKEKTAGVSPHVSPVVGECIFGQFDMRVQAYKNSQQFSKDELEAAVNRRLP